MCLTSNRWHNILPYDSTRVVIHPSNTINNKSNNIANTETASPGIPSDYINANHVR